MNQNNHMGIAIEELYRIFEMLNRKYFEDGLPYPIITIQAAKRKGQYVTNGWFTLDPVWKPNVEVTNDKYEINLCAERLKEMPLFIVETLAHEMVHYYNKLADIKDCSGQKHNKHFRDQAEKAGLLCVKDDKFGYGITTPSDGFGIFVNSIMKPSAEAFSWFRENVVKDKPEKEKKKTIFKYRCPDCGLEAKAKKDILLMCGTCKVDLIIEDDGE